MKEVRKNQGKQPIYALPMRQFMISIDEDSLEVAKHLGEGNVSAGVRKALKMANDDRMTREDIVPGTPV